MCDVNICCAYFQTSSGITIREGSSFNSSASHSVPHNHDNTEAVFLCNAAVIPFMGSCGGSLPSGITGDGGGLSILSLSSGSTSDSSVKTAASDPGSAGRLGPGYLHMRS